MTKPEKDPLDQLEEDLKGVGRGINHATRSVANGIEKVYDDLEGKFDLEDRFKGAAAGGKIAFLTTIKTVPPLVKPLTAAGAVAGFLAGKKGMDKYRKWRDGDAEEQDVANDQDEKPQEEGSVIDQGGVSEKNIDSSGGPKDPSICP